MVQTDAAGAVVSRKDAKGAQRIQKIVRFLAAGAAVRRRND